TSATALSALALSGKPTALPLPARLRTYVREPRGAWAEVKSPELGIPRNVRGFSDSGYAHTLWSGRGMMFGSTSTGEGVDDNPEVAARGSCGLIADAVDRVDPDHQSQLHPACRDYVSGSLLSRRS